MSNNKTVVLLLLLVPNLVSGIELGQFRFTGFLETYYQSYGCNKDSLRLPESTYRIQLSSQLEGYNLTIPIRLVIDQDQSNLRQSINKFLFNPKWDKGELWLGDFYPVLSELSVSGINMQGIGVKIKSKAFNLIISGGQSNKPVEPVNSIGGTFRRYMVATKLGVGNQESFFFDINGMKAWDDTGSINQGTNLPQDNLLLSLQSGINTEVFQINGEYAISGHTRNVLASTLDNYKVSPPFGSLFKPHVGSRKSEAMILNAALNLSSISLKADFKRIMPGFVSLGRTYSDEDIQDIFGELRWRTKSNKVTLVINGGTSSDNLTDEKLFTTNTNRGFLQLTTIISSKLTLNLSYNGLLLKNDADTNQINQFNHTLTINPLFRLGEAVNAQTLSILLCKQWLDDRSSLTAGFNNYFLNATWTYNRGSNLTLTAGTGFNFTDYDTTSTNIFTLNGNINYRPWNILSCNFGLITAYGNESDSKNDRTDIKANVSYEPTKFDKISLEATNSDIITDRLGQSSFTETVMQLSYRRRL